MEHTPTQYAVMAGGTLWSVHRRLDNAWKSRRKFKKKRPLYHFSVSRLECKGERPGWQRGDTPWPRYWEIIDVMERAEK